MKEGRVIAGTSVISIKDERLKISKAFRSLKPTMESRAVLARLM